jgi:hypothetical protein
MKEHIQENKNVPLQNIDFYTHRMILEERKETIQIHDNTKNKLFVDYIDQ